MATKHKTTINAGTKEMRMTNEDMLEMINDDQKENLEESAQYIKKINAKLHKKERLLEKANNKIKELKLQLTQCDSIINNLRNQRSE